MFHRWNIGADRDWSVDLGLVELFVQPYSCEPGDKRYVGGVRWWNDHEQELCASIEDAKLAAKRLAIAHLNATVREIESELES